MSPNDASPRSTLFSLFPEGVGVVLYVREARAPWSLKTVLGDAQGVFGVAPSVLRRSWSDLVHPEDLRGVDEALSAIPPGGSSSMEYRVTTSAGGERWLRDSVRRTPAPREGEQLVCLARDVTGERFLRLQVGSLEERIWRMQRMDSLGEIAAGIAHDLGNLFASALGTLGEMEEDSALPAHLRADLDVVKSGITRSAGFVKQILRFAAPERYNPGPVDLNGLVTDLKVILERSLGPEVVLTVEREPGLPRLHADPSQLEQVLLNLVVNAKEAMPGGGRLSISTEGVSLAEPLAAEGATLSPGLYVVVRVTDSGRGIPAGVMGRIFEPFFSTKAGAPSGCGFGLSTVSRIVRGLGGAVRVESEVGKGSSFRVYLPVRTATPVLPEIREPGGDRPVQGRVLVVDDDPAVRSVTLRMLARDGFSATGVGAAREALQVFDRVRPPFDIVVCDLALPDRPGPELIRMLRNRVGDLPVVYVSGYEREALPFALGTESSFLEKPFTPQELAHAVAEGMRRRGRKIPDVESGNGG